MTLAYAKIPKDILKSDISSDAKVLYACILDRYSLSQKNGWQDDDGRIYIIFPITEAMKILHCSKAKASRIFSQLGNLIEKKRQGLGKPDIIYLNISHFDNVQTADTSSAVIFEGDANNETLEGSQEEHGCVADETQDVSELTPNNNKYNKNNIIKNNQLIPSYPINPLKWIEERKEYTDKIKSNIDYDALIETRHREIIDEIVSAMANVMVTSKELIFISGEYVPKDEVKRRFLSLNQFHIEYVYDSLAKNKTDIKNMSAYLLTSLYRASDCMNLHYRSMVNCDMSL